MSFPEDGGSAGGPSWLPEMIFTKKGNGYMSLSELASNVDVYFETARQHVETARQALESAERALCTLEARQEMLWEAVQELIESEG